MGLRALGTSRSSVLCTPAVVFGPPTTSIACYRYRHAPACYCSVIFRPQSRRHRRRCTMSPARRARCRTLGLWAACLLAASAVQAAGPLAGAPGVAAVTQQLLQGAHGAVHTHSAAAPRKSAASADASALPNALQPATVLPCR